MRVLDSLASVVAVSKWCRVVLRPQAAIVMVTGDMTFEKVSGGEDKGSVTSDCAIKGCLYCARIPRLEARWLRWRLGNIAMRTMRACMRSIFAVVGARVVFTILTHSHQEGLAPERVYISARANATCTAALHTFYNYAYQINHAAWLSVHIVPSSHSVLGLKIQPHSDLAPANPTLISARWHPW